MDTRRDQTILALALTTLMSLGAAQPAHAQQPPAIAVAEAGQLQELVLRDGTRAVGRVEKVANEHVIFRTDAGAVIDVEVSQVLTVGLAKGEMHEGEYWPEDSNPTRLFFGPTARSLKKSQSYFGVYEFVMPLVQVGITDRVSIGGGAFPFFCSDCGLNAWFTPKVQVLSTEKTQAAVGMMHFTFDGNFGIAYAVATHGDANAAVTVGLGVPYSHGGKKTGDGVVMIGGERRVSRRVKLITENYLFHGGDFSLASFGVRVLGDRLSADFALGTAISGNSGGIFPVVNAVWTFGTRR